MTVGGRTPRAVGQRPGRQAVFERQRDHHLFLPGIEAMGDQPRGKGGARQPRRGLQPVQRRFTRISSTLQVPLPGAILAGSDASRQLAAALSATL